MSTHNFNNSAAAAITADLLMLDHRLLAAECAGAAGPKHACSKMGFRLHVTEQQSSFARQRRQIESVLHQQYNIHIVRLGLCRDERSKHDKTRQLARRDRKIVKTTQPITHDASLLGSFPKTSKRLRQCRRMNTDWKVSFFIIGRQRQRYTSEFSSEACH